MHTSEPCPKRFGRLRSDHSLSPSPTTLSPISLSKILATQNTYASLFSSLDTYSAWPEAQLGSALASSPLVHHTCHMGIGITLFCLGLLQISSLFLRPVKDHKYRYLWNWFHDLTRYTVLLLSFANIWVGFYILKPAKAWIIVYGVISGTMIVSTLALEVWKRLTRDGNINEANEATTTSTNGDKEV